ncbi:ATP-dependent DNA helicase MPH1 [Colletes gigas]|uniref:ATP-dependent DNA helicase MPH1 n=1 Tax=Colletes gigas TaxID=935657 RepID=UPI001C9B6FBF|nr:ATP-dependent DNA helicase MPH1 [Colletes gigas]
MEISQNPQISTDPETKGFDLSAGKTWIYPENYPIRDYQFSIVQASLYMNTLVCLPTGLGKTFIAAVVMYNFWRWYPCGKVVFLAPTKPLVAQQIFACHNIMGIPSAETIELTGAIHQKQREVAWSKKRVVFATPQVFHNDLEKNIIPADLVKCVVVDEAHKALGKHSYCECIRILSEKNQYFRVLGLSATPGNKIDNVHEVLQNLHIAHMELRDETSPDIVPYINQRKVDIILVPLNKELAEYKERYIYIMDRHVKVLIQNNVLRGQTANISKGRIFHLLKDFQKKKNTSGNAGTVMKTLNILITMYHAYELMVRDGLRAFHKFYQTHSDKFWINDETQLLELLEDIQMYLGPFPDIKSLGDQFKADIPQDLVFGHTKFEKLKELLLRHFKNHQDKENETRAIVFVEYRDIVSEVYVLLLQCQPLIRPQMFVGQARQKQKQQIKALNDFRSNVVNVLISTSIGEEGLDVGEVDLIICFDISQHSPTRLVQRMGRTGRRRDGHIIILVTDGREHETLKSTIARRDSLNNALINKSKICSSLYENNSRMIPNEFTPVCLKMYISVQPKTPVTKGRQKKETLNKKTDMRKNTLKKVAGIESKVPAQKDGTQFSIMKFVRNEKQEFAVSGISNPDKTQSNNVHRVIKPSDVQILSSDSNAIDFLTACALKNSEREANVKERSVNKFYLPQCSPIKNFFNFSIPDVKILDCLITLSDIPAKRSNEKIDLNDNNHSANDNDGNNSCINNDGCVIIDTFQENDHTNAAEKSKFEYLLDESSKSNDSDTADDIKEVVIENSKTSSQYSRANVSKETMENTNVAQDLDSSRFEDLLNETSDELESDACVENTKQIPIENIGSRNDTNIETFTNAPNVDDNIEMYSMCLQEADFALPDTIEDYKEKNKSDIMSNTCKTKDQSLLSITQAIIEIGRIKSNLNATNTVDESEDDMFEDENFFTEIDDATNLDQSVECLIESKVSNDKEHTDTSVEFNDKKSTNGAEFKFEDILQDENFSTQIDDATNLDQSVECLIENKVSNDKKVMNASPESNDKKSAIGAEIKIDDYEWDDDFEVVIDPDENHDKFDPSRKKCNEFKKSSNEVQERFSDSDEWFSVEKSYSVAKKNAPRTSIAKKLANMKKCRNSKRDCSKQLIEDEIIFENDPFVSKKEESDELGTSRLVDDREDRVNVKEDLRTKLERFKVPCSVKNRNRTRRPRKVRNVFIDDEAKVSSNDEYSSDESSGQDEDLDNFVSYTQNVHDTSDMHALYLQTVRSPVKKCNGFVFKPAVTLDPEIDIYSQPLTQGNDTYLDDSFCVAGGDEDERESSSAAELTVLEKAELELKNRKRKRVRGEEFENNAEKRLKKNKRKIIIVYSASSEDEIEILREQLKNESLLLAQSSRKNV